MVQWKELLHNRIIHSMVIEVVIDINQHKNFFFCAAETSAELYIRKIHSTLYNTSPQFVWYIKSPSIPELIKCGCYISPITPSPKELYDLTQEVSFLGYTNSREAMK